MIKMVRLTFYRNERIEFKEAFEKELSYKELEMIFKKLCRHFKINPSLCYGRGSHANQWSIQISNRWGKNFGVLCHELAHTYCFRNGFKGHNKKMWKVMTRMINYCKKKNYWQEELNKRTEIEIKPETTKEELQIRKIEHKEELIKKYERKIKMYTTKINGTRKSLIMLERFFEK